MLVKDLFDRDIFRSINGVVKADQLDDSSVWQELDEFVVTRELDQHFRKFFSNYGEAIKNPNNPDIVGKVGIWISGFFGSGKSHFIKVLSYLLRNQTHNHNGESKQAVQFFESKIKDAMLFGDIKRAVASNTDVILFNIDSKADHRSGRDAILAVMLKVLNEMQGYSGDHAHIAHMERYLDSKGKLEQFQDAFQKATGEEWLKERDSYHFHQDEVAKALSETLGQSEESCKKWIDAAECSFALTVENFCKWVKEYLDSKGSDHRIIFLVDEVGQFIGTDEHLMLNLQTITEDLGTICQGRAWIVVTSQEDIEAVLGEMRKRRENDFSKIQGRFVTRLSLSSSNVDEVIQSRLLSKRPEAVDDLQTLYCQKGDILKNQLSFLNCGMTFKSYHDSEDFVKNYPFAPYQFQLLQRIFESIRKAGATGSHLSRGERSILDAFQDASKQVALLEVGVLVPLYSFYPSIANFLDTSVKRTIDQAKDNPSLEQPLDVHLLEVLFLIRYVEEIKSNVDNLVTLCMDQIDGDRLALRRKIEESLQRLENQTLISRNGDLYFFLTNEERDINKEIKNEELSSGEEARTLGEIVFNDILKDQRKYRYPVNKMDFTFNRLCDSRPIGNQSEGALLVSLISPLNDDYEMYDNGKCVLESGTQGGHILVRLGNEELLGREIRTYLQTSKYIRLKNDGTLSPSTTRILNDLSSQNSLERRPRLIHLLSEMLGNADFYVAGESLKLKAGTPMVQLDEALEYLVKNTFTKMGYLKHLNPDPLKEVQAILRSNDVQQQTLALDLEEGNKQAFDDIRSFVELSTNNNRQVVLHDMIEKRYSIRPYGWPDEEILILIARLLILGEISLMMDGAIIPLDKAYESITTPAKRRKILVIKRHTSDPKAIQNARALGKELFHEMGPDGEDPLFSFLQSKLREWQTNLTAFKTLADTEKYPGKDDINEGLGLSKKLLNINESFKFIEQFNSLKKDLLDYLDQYQEVDHFYEHQKPTWEKLRTSYDRFQLNRLDLERDAQAEPTLKRMAEILKAPSPYGLIKEVEGLIATVNGVNTALLTERRTQTLTKIDGHIATLTKDIETAHADTSYLKPLQKLRQQAEIEDSLAHLNQANDESLRQFDIAIRKIEEFVKKEAEKTQKPSEPSKPSPPKSVIKTQRVVKPSEMVHSPYLETMDDVQTFLDALRKQLEEAIANNERIQIR